MLTAGPSRRHGRPLNMATRARAALLLAALLTLTVSLRTDGRDLVLTEGAYELVLTDIELPATATGRVAFRPCAGCARLNLPVTADTAYFIDGGRLGFTRFLESVTKLRASGARNTSFVGLYYAMDSSRVTRIEIVTR